MDAADLQQVLNAFADAAQNIIAAANDTAAAVAATQAQVAADAAAAAAAAQVAAADRRALAYKLTPMTVVSVDSWFDYKRCFTAAMDFHGWNLRVSRKMLVANIQSSAGKMIKEIDHGAGPAVADDDLEPLDLLMTSLERRFLPEHTIQAARISFNGAKQEDGEQLNTWHSRLYDLFRQAHPAMAVADMDADVHLRLKFIEELSDPRVKRQLMIEDVQSYIAVLDRSWQLHGTMRFSKGAESYTGETKATGHVGSLGEAAGAASRTACFFCHREGHHKHECRDFLRTNRPPTSRGRSGPSAASSGSSSSSSYSPYGRGRGGRPKPRGGRGGLRDSGRGGRRRINALGGEVVEEEEAAHQSENY